MVVARLGNASESGRASAGRDEQPLLASGEPLHDEHPLVLRVGFGELGFLGCFIEYQSNERDEFDMIAPRLPTHPASGPRHDCPTSVGEPALRGEVGESQAGSSV